MYCVFEDVFVDLKFDDVFGIGNWVVRVLDLIEQNRDSKVFDFVGFFDFVWWLIEVIWVYDIDWCWVVLVNDEVLCFWQVFLEEELLVCDFFIDMLLMVVRWLKQYQVGFDKSDVIYSELWMFYLNGELIFFDVIYIGYWLFDGWIVMLCEMKVIVEDFLQMLCSVEVLFYIDVRIVLFVVSGLDLYMNLVVCNMWFFDEFWLQNVFLELLDYDEIFYDLECYGEIWKVCQVKIVVGVVWYDMLFKSCSDVVIGVLVIFVILIDVSELKKV